MNIKTSSRNTIVLEPNLQAIVAETVHQVGGKNLIKVILETGTGEKVVLPRRVAELVQHVLIRTAKGGEISIKTVPESLTTSTAADLLGISRTMVMKLIQSGELVATKVGSHHRLKYTDVVKLRERREEKRALAIREMLELEED